MNGKSRSVKVNIGNSALMPKEEHLETTVRFRGISIGIPADVRDDEKRVALTPEAVNILVESDNEVIVQKGAGAGCNYSDKDYSENGAIITESPARVYGSDVVIKVAQFTAKEANYLKGNQVVMSYLNVFNLSEETLAILVRKKTTAIAFERIRDKSGIQPVTESMSEICGVTSVMLASEYLSNHHGGKGIMLGGITGITPTEVVILGANTAGEFAARAALGLGAQVKVFDNSLQKLRKIETLVGQRLQTSVFHPQVLRKTLRSADVLIGAIGLEDLRSCYYVTEDMVRTMKNKAVIIDLSIDRGGCIETSEYRAMKDPVYEKHGVIHFSAWNLPSRVPRTASMALSNIFAPILQKLAESGGITQVLKNDPGFRNGVYLYNGILTNEILGHKFNILPKDLDLLLSAF